MAIGVEMRLQSLTMLREALARRTELTWNFIEKYLAKTTTKFRVEGKP